MRSDLKSRRRALQDRLRDLSGCLALGPSGRDNAGPLCAATRPQNRHAAEVEAASIYAALRRMDRGEYGACVSCGAEIARERLDAFPFTAHCGECAPLTQ